MRIGHEKRAIPEGYIPSWSNGPEPRFASRETACSLDAADEDARVEVAARFTDRESAMPCRMAVPARRAFRVRFDELDEPGNIPLDSDFASIVEPDMFMAVRRTRFGSRRAEDATVESGVYTVEER